MIENKKKSKWIIIIFNVEIGLLNFSQVKKKQEKTSPQPQTDCFFLLHLTTYFNLKLKLIARNYCFTVSYS